MTSLKQDQREIDRLEAMASILRAREGVKYGPRAMGYCRVSTDEQLQGKSLEAQQASEHLFYQRELQREGVSWFRYYTELEGTSAYSIPFHRRPEACKLLLELRPGDHLIVDKVDRIFRKLKDFVLIQDLLIRRGAYLHIVDMMGISVSQGTPMGDFILHLMVLLAQLESQQISNRVRKVLTAKFFDYPGLGFRRPSRNRYKRVKVPPKNLVKDETERRIMSFIVSLRADQCSWHQIARRLKQNPDCAAYKDGFWAGDTVQDAFHQELWLRRVEEVMEEHGLGWREAMIRVGKPEYAPVIKQRTHMDEWVEDFHARRRQLTAQFRQSQIDKMRQSD